MLDSEAPESQSKLLLGLIWPSPDSIKMVGLPGSHLNPCNIQGMCFGGKIIGCNSGPGAFLGLILLVSEAPESQLKVFFWWIWPILDSINMVGWPWGPLSPSSIPGMCLVGITW